MWWWPKNRFLLYSTERWIHLTSCTYYLYTMDYNNWELWVTSPQDKFQVLIPCAMTMFMCIRRNRAQCVPSTHSGDSPWHRPAVAVWPWARCWSWWRYRGAGGPRCSACWGPAPQDCTGRGAAAPSPTPGAPRPRTKLHNSGTEVRMKRSRQAHIMIFEKCHLL